MTIDKPVGGTDWSKRPSGVHNLCMTIHYVYTDPSVEQITIQPHAPSQTNKYAHNRPISKFHDIVLQSFDLAKQPGDKKRNAIRPRDLQFISLSLLRRQEDIKRPDRRKLTRM